MINGKIISVVFSTTKLKSFGYTYTEYIQGWLEFMWALLLLLTPMNSYVARKKERPALSWQEILASCNVFCYRIPSWCNIRKSADVIWFHHNLTHNRVRLTSKKRKKQTREIRWLINTNTNLFGGIAKVSASVCRRRRRRKKDLLIKCDNTKVGGIWIWILIRNSCRDCRTFPLAC